MSYLVEVVSSNAAQAATPGWAYVPEFRRDVAPSAAGGRKRTTRDTGVGRGDISSRQQTAINRRLAEFDRENFKDVHIPVPNKQKDPAIKSSRSKTTSNVRRILMSQKTFKNYLDDEEAAVALAPPTASRTNAARTSRPAASTPKPTDRRITESCPPPTPSEPAAVTSQLIVSEFDNDPLLRSYIPTAPSERIMQALLSEPPLSYNASRATFGSSDMQRSPRKFCVLCGFWGKIKCVTCSVRICGLGCLNVHKETTCNRGYA